MWTWMFWKDALERAVKTFAQTFISLVAVAGPIQGFELLNLNYLPILAVGAIAAVLSILMSLASSLKGDHESASLVK